MDDIKKANLQKQRDTIVKDLQVEDILDELYTLQVLNADDVDSIRKAASRKDKVLKLLQVFAKKDNRAYDTLVNVLKKDYDWLSKALHTVDNDNYDNLIQEAFQDTLVLGDVPRRPPRYVERVEPLRDLQRHLEELEPCQRIVLHGMTGSGKSCLAAAAVKNAELLQAHFHNRVFWINLGEVKTIHQLPSHMTVLLQRLTNDIRDQNKRRPISLLTAVEGDIAGEIQVLKTALKNLFCGSYRNALLVLDNVSLQEATEAFDVGCKTLITTQDKDVVVGNNTIYMQVKGGFTEMETLLLFANSLHTDVKQLPQHASRIHHLCKGEPILIALIGSLLEPYKEDLLAKSDHWEYYIKKLTKKEYNLKNKLFRTIKICIDGLDIKLRELYRSFAVFVEDVNITPNVMQTLWNLEDIYAVKDKMAELQNKSLIVSYYNTELNTYVYGIHDLFLAYLKNRLGQDGVVEQHMKLISAYKGISNNNFANLPNDNYIYQYIGYHLKEAKLESEFKIYFDLNFIAAKIKAIGIADLLRDFHVYNKYITRDDESLVNKLNEYVKFIKARGHDLYKYLDTDIVQAGLGQNKDSSVYKAALAITKENPKTLYFQLQSPQESVYFTHTLDLSHDVSAACFTGDVNQILVGMTNGDINLWEQAYNQKLNIFAGHTDRIVSLQLSPERNGFLSVSADGSVKIWCLKGVVLRSSNGDVYDENGFNKHIPSPRVKQSNWTNFYGTSGRIDHSKTCRLLDDKDKLICASYANETDYQIVTGCEGGKVLVWKVLVDEHEPTIVLTIPGRAELVNCVTFSGDDTLVIFSCGASIFVHDALKGDFLSQFYNKSSVKSLLVVPELDTTLVAMHDSTVTMWTWNQVGTKVFQPAMTELDIKGEAKFLCGAVTDDGMYFVAGSNDYYIRVWHIGTAQIVQEFLNKGLVVCLDTFYDDTKNAVHILLSGSDDKTVKQWHIQPTLQVKDTAKLLPIFDCYWNSSSSVPRIAVVNSNNKVQIMHGHNLIIESEIINSPIKAVRFSLCGNKVAIGLENGRVKEFDYKNRSYETLMTLHDCVVLLKYFNASKDAGCTNCSKNDLLLQKVVLVATAQNGWVSVYSNGRALCLIQPSASNVAVKQVPVIPIVQCFYIRNADKLLAVSQNRTIKSWNIDNGIASILYGDKIQYISSSTVMMATLSPSQSLLAIAMNDGCFEIYTINVDESAVSLVYNQGKNLNNPLWSCRFSHNEKILALGQDDGHVVIWSVESKVVIHNLDCNKSSVRYLLFSPSPGLILVSVGEQIVWWDITKLPEQHNGNRNYRRRSSSAKKDLTIAPSTQMSHLNLGMWNDKEGQLNKPHLLSAIKVRGFFSTYISASHDFTSFFTIDNNGYLYVMEMLKQSNF